MMRTNLMIISSTNFHKLEIHKYTYICVYICLYVCLHIYTHIYEYLYIYIHISNPYFGKISRNSHYLNPQLYSIIQVAMSRHAFRALPEGTVHSLRPTSPGNQSLHFSMYGKRELHPFLKE